MLVCDKCNARINEGSKFCPQCGDPVTEDDRVHQPVTEGQQIASVEISFGQSSSQHFTTAVEICKNIPSYTVVGEGKLSVHKITLPITEVDLLINLFELVGNWKSSKMLINGRAATKKNLTFYGVGCYRNRQKAYKPEQFCFGEHDYEANIWGCKRLGMPALNYYRSWLCYGSFDKSGAWSFDKDRIKHDLEVKIKENELCPVLDKKRVLEALANLPDNINPKKDKNWSYITEHQETSRGYSEVAIGVRPAFKTVSKYVAGSFKPEWVTGGNPTPSTGTEIVVDVDDVLDHGKQRSKKKGSWEWLWGG